MGGVPVYLVIGDWGQKLLVIWWFEPKKCGDLVILRSCGDGDLALKSMVIWWFLPQNLGDLVIYSYSGYGDFDNFWKWWKGDKYIG